MSSGGPEHVRVSSVWPKLRQGWSRRVESEANSASATPMDVDAKTKERNASCADVPATQRKTANSVKVRAEDRTLRTFFSVLLVFSTS